MGRSWTTACCALAVLVAAGCGQAAAPLPTPVRPAVVPSTSASDALEGTGDEPIPTEPRSVVGTAVPAGMPPGFPLPVGKVVSSEAVDAEEGASFTVAIETAAPPAAAAAAYASALRGAGYEIEVGEDGSVVFTRGGEREQGAAGFEPRDGGSRAFVTLTVAD